MIILLASAAGAFLGIALVEVLMRSRSSVDGLRSPRFGLESLTSILRLVPVPGVIQRQWGNPDTGLKMKHAGLAWHAQDFAALRWLLLWASAFIGCALVVLRQWDLVGQFLAILVIALGFLWPGVFLRRRIERRQQEVEIFLPDFLDRLALGLDAGLGFEIALRRTAVDFSGLLGEELRRLVRQLDRGYVRSDALDELNERISSHDLRAFTASVKQADRLGTSLSKTLRVQTGLLRANRKRRAQEASRRLPILIVFPLVFFFLPSLLIIYLVPPLLHLFLGH
ncbi:MAG: type II secretion system F family protein [Anaerolineales bacterium]|jgi:tight adherence protein C